MAVGIGVEWLPAALIARSKPAMPAGRLPDRELRSRTRRWWLPLGARQRRANQPAMGGPLLGILAGVLFAVALGSIRIGGRLDVRGRSRCRPRLFHGNRV